MAFNTKRNRLYLLLIGVFSIALAIFVAYKSGKVTNGILLFYLIGIIALFMQQAFRLHAIRTEINDSSFPEDSLPEDSFLEKEETVLKKNPKKIQKNKSKR